jgi:hypothetical protein
VLRPLRDRGVAVEADVDVDQLVRDEVRRTRACVLELALLVGATAVGRDALVVVREQALDGCDVAGGD